MKTVLVIDTDSSNRKLISICLKNGGYQVLTADNGEEALKLLKNIRPQVVLMDIKLGDMDGLQLSRILKDNPETRDIVVIALTTHAWKDDENKIRGAGCDGFIFQPFDTRSFARIIDSYLEKHAV